MEPSSASKEWFATRKLGLFLHFGLYAINGWHEQEQWRRRIPRAQYRELSKRFNPTAFDPDAIIDLAQSAGMEYLCLTTKHHDGFCLWDTKCTDFNVMNTPARRDLVGELAEACHRRAFPLGLYYSIPDWHHPNYPNTGLHHQLPCPEPGDEPDWDLYYAYLREQVLELMTNYGEIKHFFWDINVTEHRDPSLNARIRELQPGIVINNRGFDDGDFGTPERDYNADETERVWRFPRPTEACNSVGMQSWGYRTGEDFYAASFLISGIDATMAKGGNYLLNVGPAADGSIPSAYAERIDEVGCWYRRVRESFADTVPASNLTDNPQVLVTQRDEVVYVHVQRPFVSSSLVLAPIEALPLSATLLNTGERVDFSLEALPYYWANAGRYLVLRNIPLAAMAHETPVIRLEFGSLLEAHEADYKLSNAGQL